MGSMAKKATITVSLLEESEEKTNRELENEIFRELTRIASRIPWCKKIEKVKVIDLKEHASVQ